jgi:hypothetical protein
VYQNRWGKLLEQNIILEQFKNKREYHDFIKTNTSKVLADELQRDPLLFNTEG